MERRVPPAKAFVKEISQSSLCLAICGLTGGLSCYFRHVLGKYYFPTLLLIPGFLCAFLGIIIEKKSKRGQLALYGFALAVETLFHMFAKRGYVKRLRHGEIYLCMFAMGVLMRSFRSEQLQKGFVPACLRVLLGEVSYPGPLRILKTETPETEWQAKLSSCARQSMIMFVFGCTSKTILKLLLSARLLLKNPGRLLEISMSKDNLNVGVSLGSFVFLFKLCEYVFQNFITGYHQSTAFIAGAISGLSMGFNKSSSLAIYLFSKAVEQLYKQGISCGLLPSFQSGDVLLFSVSVGILVHAAFTERDTVRRSYLRLLSSLSARVDRVDRKRLEELFGEGCW